MLGGDLYLDFVLEVRINDSKWLGSMGYKL